MFDCYTTNILIKTINMHSIYICKNKLEKYITQAITDINKAFEQRIRKPLCCIIYRLQANVILKIHNTLEPWLI